MIRTLALTLCAALAAGAFPDPAAAAAVIAPAEAGSAFTRVVMPAAPVAGMTAPALSAPGLGVPVVLPVLPGLFSPQAAPAAAAVQAAVPVQAAVQARAEAAPAAASLAMPARAFATARPAAIAAGVPAVQVQPQGAERPLERTLKAVRAAGAEAAGVPLLRLSPDAGAAAAGRLFDNAARRGGTLNAVRLPAAVTAPFAFGARLARAAVARSPLGRLLPAAAAERWGRPPPPAPVKTAFSRDDFGGPQALPAPAPGRGRLSRAFNRAARDARYGLKWGVSLFGLASLLQATLKPLAAMVPWVSWIPHGLLSAFGRAELLTSMGPAAVAGAVADAPLSFFGLLLPRAVLMEELSYRLASFGLTFFLLAAVRPAASRLASFLDDVPDLFGVRSGFQKALRWAARLSAKAFPVAAGLSAWSFAAAHFAAWGVAPYTFALHLSLGLALAWVAYRSRGLTAPFAAHLSYNALAIGLGVLLPLYVLPQTASLAAAVAGVLAVTFLYYQARSWFADKAAAEAAARGRTPAAPSAWKRAKRWLTLSLVPVVMLGAVSLASGPRVQAPPHLPPAAAAPAAPAPRAPAAARAALSVEDIVKAAKPAVVMVLTPRGLGSGFIVSPDGLLVTNGHVVSYKETEDPLYTGYTRFVKVRFANGLTVAGKVVGFNAAKDLALIQLPPNPFGWPTVTLGDSGALAEGQDVVAMGYPRGLPFTVTRGIVSGLGRRSNGWVSYIQHDASVNPGNSGGPLFDRQGTVVGVNSMIISPSGGFAGISYSITSADVQKALDQFAKQGNISPAWLGVILDESGASSDFGVAVDAVRAGSPAAAAGLRAGDVLIGLEGRSVAGDPDQALKALALTLRAKAPGDLLKLQAYRDGAVVDLTVRLAAP